MNEQAAAGIPSGGKKNLRPEDEVLPGPDPALTNYQHPTAPGERTVVPGAGVVRPEADAGPRENAPNPRGRPFPGRDAPDAVLMAPGAERPGTTEGRAASAARGGAQGGLEEIETPSARGQTAYAPTTGGTGAPSPGSSGVPATSDPNFPTNAHEGGVSKERGNNEPRPGPGEGR